MYLDPWLLRSKSPVGNPQLIQFSREVIDLLKSQPSCVIPISNFIPSYHHHFAKQCRVSDYGYSKLIELLEAVPHVLQVRNARGLFVSRWECFCMALAISAKETGHLVTHFLRGQFRAEYPVRLSSEYRKHTQGGFAVFLKAVFPVQRNSVEHQRVFSFSLKTGFLLTASPELFTITRKPP